MTRERQSVLTGMGTRLQSGLTHKLPPRITRAANGLLLRGVVVQTYVADDPDLPGSGQNPSGVYCDVLTYSSIPTVRYQLLRAVPVLQDRAGLHSGRAWKPRATSFDVTGSASDVERATNPANMDGDHVLIGFMDDATNLPIIMGAVPHPNNDHGNEDKSTGHRLRLKLVDGDPDFIKHHGSFYGIDTEGNFVADTTFANTGELDATGKEAAPPVDGTGSQRQFLPQDAERRTEWFDMSTPSSPVSVAREVLTKDQLDLWLKDQVNLVIEQAKLELKLQNGATLKIEGKDATAKETLGNGAVSAAIAERLQVLYTALKTAADLWGSTHVHPTAWGPSGPPAPPLSCPAWDATIPSTKLKFPDL